ncbi:MAG: 4-hydroxyphenylacetate 3-monooxygenase [Alphaproteobacteria bacterium]|nr:4-hydroxyphenylacetate 3-monooxygenase [Alphaproteobacteria bacterium]
MIKTAARHLESLRDGREVFLRGQRVDDVTTHKAFRNSVASAAYLYDFQAAPENAELMTYASPDRNVRVSRSWQLPTSYAELRQRRSALDAWASTHFGFMGRSPDHVASCIGGMVMGLDVFEAYDKKRAGALYDYYRYARDNDLFLTYVIVNPQADRAKATGEQADPFLVVREVERDHEGIIVKGAKMLGTSSIMANEVLVASIQPLQAGEEPYALSFCVPMNAKGLKVMSRKSYEEAAESVYDNPLSSRYDENDAVLYFDEVKVPWERVFVAGDVAMSNRQFHATPSHIYQNYQCQIRLMVKLRFLVGLASYIVDTNGIGSFPPVRETLGELAAEAAMVEALVDSIELSGRQIGPYYVPDTHKVYAAQVLTQKLYPKVINTLRELAGGSMVMLPSSIDDFANPALRDYIGRTQKSPAVDPEGRVKLFKLAWDAVGSEFASRHTQYEMFYAGASFVTKSNSYRTFDWSRSRAMVDKLSNSYTLDDELKRR